ncbi:MAG: tRNA (adenosine(37)-N6)-threonylcarbamoyltransferase complex transferase subunit TsaD [Solirubrobacterales bacterium]
MILALETSCDDTCAAVLDEGQLRSSVVSTQASLHERYGGVVPEVASRRHLELVHPVVEAALVEADTGLDEIEVFAVTRKPGLIGALLIGVSAAKALASVRRSPLVGVDHLQGHVASAFLAPDPLEPPFLCLVASGGHTLLAGVRDHAEYETLGETLDDAAGEALDKAARLLDLGYPGGPAIERAAEGGDPSRFQLPVAMTRDPGLDFSFSGLKTALSYLARDLGEAELKLHRESLAAAFQRSVVDQLIGKLERALGSQDWPSVALAGGVAANTQLRDRAQELCDARGVRLKLVARELCTDNAAMIGSAARYVEPTPYPDYLGWDALAA